MICLLRGANLWKSGKLYPVSSIPPSSSSYNTFADTFLLYDERIKQSRSEPFDMTRCCFRYLVDDLLVSEEGSEGSSVAVPTPLVSNGDTLLFCPLHADPDNVRGSQRAALLSMIGFWQEKTTVRVLTVDLSSATISSIRDVMRGATYRDVARGLYLWSTFPCRITRIVVLTPKQLPMWSRIVTKIVPLIAPKKVLEKTQFC